MPDSRANGACPKCGRVLSLEVARGLCSKCLLNALLEGDSLDSAAQSASGKLILPRPFGSYELIEEIARGGMGIVYKARQTQIHRLVAVKVMVGGQFASSD